MAEHLWWAAGQVSNNERPTDPVYQKNILRLNKCSKRDVRRKDAL